MARQRHTPQRAEGENMAIPREATNLAEFVKFTAIGAIIFGRIVRQGENNNGPFVIMEPAGFRPNATAPFARYQELAVGLTTDLRSKVRSDDTGKMLALVFVSTRPTNNKPMKIFNVYEIGPAEAKKMLDTNEVQREWLVAPEQEQRVNSVAGAPPELPF